MDIQKLFDTMAGLERNTRSRYHLTLGALQKALAATQESTLVRFDSGYGVSSAGSYRGYYSDLAFESADRAGTAGELLAVVSKAIGKTYEGYKGGDYVMGEETPLWSAPYGSCGRAIVGYEMREGVFTLLTKDVDA